MYDLNQLCCICLCKEKNLKSIFEITHDEITCYAKLVSCIPEMSFKEMNARRLGCGKCFSIIDTLYEFREKCLRNKTILIGYVAKELSSEILSDHLTDVSQKYIKEVENQQNDEEKSLVNQFLSDEKCQEICFENVMIRENNSFGVNFNETENKFDDMESVQVKVEENYDDTNDINYEICNPNIHLRTQNPNLETDFVQYDIVKIKCESDVGLNENELSVGESSIDKNETCRNTGEEEHILTKTNIGSYTRPQKPTKRTSSNKIPKLKICTIRNTGIKKTHDCSVCMKQFSHMSHLIPHMRIHTGEKPHECSICGKKFRQPTHLNTHMRTHTGEKPYECTICTKKFSDFSCLTNHVRIHTGEKPHECTICKKNFIQSNHLTNHMRIHTGEKPYECSVCPRKFSRSDSLNCHMRIHSGDKLHECVICRKKFNRPFNLNHHMRTHTE